MKNYKKSSLKFLVIFAFAVCNFTFAQENTKTNLVTVKNFSSAARQNAELKKSLQWTFGSKTQTGWYLYIPLIQHTIGTNQNADSEGFAGAVAVWQKRNGLLPNGVIDKKTLSEMIKFWQSRRLRKIEDAPENALFFAPIADFYDPTRDISLLKVEKQTYAA